MVKFATLAVAVIGSLAPMVAADNCKTGLNYCGYNLLNIGMLCMMDICALNTVHLSRGTGLLTWTLGNYGSQVNEAVSDAGQPTDNEHTHESLFHCNGGANGDISFISFCDAGCKDGGSGNSDSC